MPWKEQKSSTQFRNQGRMAAKLCVDELKLPTAYRMQQVHFDMRRSLWKLYLCEVFMSYLCNGMSVAPGSLSREEGASCCQSFVIDEMRQEERPLREVVWCLQREEKIDPYSSPYVTPNSSPHNPFPNSLLRTRQAIGLEADQSLSTGEAQCYRARHGNGE